ncbi:MAG: hypothetical protein KF751_01215 [Nitrospira sp.]|nr:hypothetical protein [Nitrospira sp.]
MKHSSRRVASRRVPSFETIFLAGMAEVAAGWRWGVMGPEGRDGFETGDAVAPWHPAIVAHDFRSTCVTERYSSARISTIVSLELTVMPFQAGLGLCAVASTARINAAWTGGMKDRGSRSLQKWRMT